VTHAALETTSDVCLPNGIELFQLIILFKT